jgi:hypothetical protein
MITSAVPRSGWLAMSRTAAPDDVHHRAQDPLERAHHRRLVGQQPHRVEHQGDLHELRRLELQRAGADPARGAVDLHAEPRDLDEHQQREGDEQQRRREVADAGQVHPRHDEHDREAERAVDDVLDQVGGAVALALQDRARRGGAVDHDRARSQQAQGGGEQDPVLQRLLAGGGARSVHQADIRRRRPVSYEIDAW